MKAAEILRPCTFVLLDRVETLRPDAPKTWLLHSRNEPEIAGNSFTVKDGKGTLHVRTLLPESPRWTKWEADSRYGGKCGGRFRRIGRRSLKMNGQETPLEKVVETGRFDMDAVGDEP